MCGIAIVFNQNYFHSSLHSLRHRGRDHFGAWTGYGAVVTSPFIEDLPPNAKLLFSRAVPESEPDLLDPQVTQPVAITPYVAFAFHGLIHTPDGSSDVAYLANFLKEHGFHKADASNWPTMAEAFNKLKGSYLIILSYENQYFLVISNFLAAFYDKNRLWTIPFPSSLPIEPNTAYLFTDTGKLISKQTITPFEPRKALVICSGGLDSATVATFLARQGLELTFLHFSYGQDAEFVEETRVKDLAKHFDAELIKIRLQGLEDDSPMFKPLKVLDSLEDQELPVHYVRARNTLFAGYGLSTAEKIGADLIAFGVNLTEGMVYPDNGNLWFYHLQNLSKVATIRPIRAVAPLLNLLKKEIIKLASTLEAPLHLTSSCYHPNVLLEPCGRCGSCRNRLKAFLAAGMKDPLNYQSLDVLTKEERKLYQKLPPFFTLKEHKLLALTKEVYNAQIG